MWRGGLRGPKISPRAERGCVFSSPEGSMKARMPRMLLTVCAEGQALDMLICPADTGTPGGLPIFVPVGDMVLG